MKIRSKCKLAIATLLTLCLAMTVVFAPSVSTNVKAEELEGPDPNFHIYIAFGQSNMDGNAVPEDQDKDVPDGFLNMCSDDGHKDQTVGEWYPAVPPLSRQQDLGLGITDYFGRRLLEVKQETNPDIKIGVICVAVPGCPTSMFDKDKYQEFLDADDTADWLINVAKQYGGNPYGRIIELAKKAQEQGIIKGIIYHQGETDGNEGWASRMKKIYEDMVTDLGLENSNIPFIAGECVPKMSSQNANIRKLADMGDNFYVASSEGLVDKGDGLHFSPESYREYGPRYADIMLEHEPQTTYSDPVYEWSADNSTVKASRHCNELPSYVEEETVNTTKEVIKEATATAPGSAKYTADFKNPAFEKQTKTAEIKQVASTTPTQTQPTTNPQAQTANPGTTTTTPVADATQNAEEKTLSLSSVKCKKNTKKITGKVSESGVTVKIKVGKKAAKKATVKGKKFTLKLSYKLAKKTKVVITVTKKDFKSLKKTYTVK